MTDQDRPTATHPVHPRQVWGGLLIALLGLTVLGIGASTGPRWLGIVGAVALVAGAGLAMVGGLRYDTRSGAVSGELRDLEEGEVHAGRSPSQRLHDDTAEATAARDDERRRSMISAREETGRPPLAPIGAGLLVLVSVCVLVGQWTIYPIGQTGQDNALRDLAFGIVAGLAGMRILVAHPGRHLVAAGAGLLAGLGLLLVAVLADHTVTRTLVWEVVGGGFALIGAALCLVSPGVAPWERRSS